MGYFKDDICDYYDINKFVRTNDDYLGELINIYINK